MTVEEGGAPCACGSRGCLESYLGGRFPCPLCTNGVRKKGKAVDRLDPKILQDLARSGNVVAKDTWHRASRALGIALANLVNLLNPDTILLTGRLRGAPRPA